MLIITPKTPFVSNVVGLRKRTAVVLAILRVEMTGEVPAAGYNVDEFNKRYCMR